MTFYLREQVFTSPGTWVCPPTVTWVEVTVVGGGGGSGAMAKGWFYSPRDALGAGGGGAVLRRTVPVGSPVPITVGAGGAGGVPYNSPPAAPVAAPNNAAGQVGGTSAFGSLGPGPVPSIPATTIAAGGGGGGYGGAPPYPPSSIAMTGRYVLPIGGGSGGAGDTSLYYLVNKTSYGSPNHGATGGGAGSMIWIAREHQRTGQYSLSVPGSNPEADAFGFGLYGYGGGGLAHVPVQAGPTSPTSWTLPSPTGKTPVDGGGLPIIRRQNTPVGPYTVWPNDPDGSARANSGGGAGGFYINDPLGVPIPTPPTYTDGVAGASGVVIVRWNE